MNLWNQDFASMGVATSVLRLDLESAWKSPSSKVCWVASFLLNAVKNPSSGLRNRSILSWANSALSGDRQLTSPLG
jgi:hypothetical protein